MKRILWLALFAAAPLRGAWAQDADEPSAPDTPVATPAPAPVATPVDDTDAEAKRLYTSGAELYEEGRYAMAIKAFREAYAMSGRHTMLMNIANAHERLGELSEAVTALDEYRIYADEATKAKLERRIRTLEQRIAEENQAAAAAAAATPAPLPTPAPAPVATSRANPTKWVLLGTGGVLAGAFGATALVTYGNGQDAASEGNRQAYDSARTLNTVSGVVAGTGGALAVIGLALPARRNVSLAPMGAGVRVGVRF